jgi:hypothetical protein
MGGPSEQRDLHLAEEAYEAYRMQTGGKSLVTGDDLPPWEGLGDAIKTAWIAAARAVEAAVGV